MKVKTSELKGTPLDWVVAKLEDRIGGSIFGEPQVIEGKLHLHYCGAILQSAYSPSTDWDIGGVILEKMGISVIQTSQDYRGEKKWAATKGEHSQASSTEHQHHDSMYQVYVSEVSYGETYLLAGLRAYVKSEMGWEVNIPEEILK